MARRKNSNDIGPGLCLLILIIGGFIMLSMGVIGHYIARIYEEVKGRPKYIIRDVTGNVRGNIKDEDKE